MRALTLLSFVFVGLLACSGAEQQLRTRAAFDINTLEPATTHTTSAPASAPNASPPPAPGDQKI